MPPTCHTCQRSDVQEINALIISGKPLRYITDNYEIPNGSIQRHKENCLPELFKEAREQHREGLLGKIDSLERKFLLVESEFNGNWQARIAAGAKQIELLDKEAKLTGAYLKEQENPQTTEAIANKMAAKLVKDGHFTAIDDAKQWLANVENDVSIEGIIG